MGKTRSAGFHLIFTNFVKSSDVNCDPLSVNICSGIPCIANNCRNTIMVLAVEVCGISTTSAHLEWASTTIKKNFSKNGPAKSKWILCQGQLGHTQGCKGALSGASFTTAHSV